MPPAGNSLRAEKLHWHVQKVTLAGPKSHTRAKMPHWSVIIDIIACWWQFHHAIMAGRAFVVAKEVFIMETVVF